MDKKEFRSKLFDLEMRLAMLGPRCDESVRQSILDEKVKLKHEYALQMFEEIEKEKKIK